MQRAIRVALLRSPTVCGDLLSDVGGLCDSGRAVLIDMRLKPSQ